MTISILGECGGLERTDFQHFPLWENVVILKGLILDSFHIGRVFSLERTDFGQFLDWKAVVVSNE